MLDIAPPATGLWLQSPPCARGGWGRVKEINNSYGGIWPRFEGMCAEATGIALALAL